MIYAPFSWTTLILVALYLIHRTIQIGRTRFSILQEIAYFGLFFSLWVVAREAFKYYEYSWPVVSQMSINTEPFGTIRHMLEYRGFMSERTFIANIYGNALLFAPLGMLAPLLLRRARSWWKLILTAMAFSLTIELVQCFIPGHALDIDDVILNSFSVLPGYWLYLLLNRFTPIRRLRCYTEDSGEDTLSRFYFRWAGGMVIAILVTVGAQSLDILPGG